MTQKLSQHEQLAEWRKQQKQKSRQNLKSWGDRAKSTDFLKVRLRFWGAFLMILGLLTSGLEAVDLYYEELYVQTAVAVVWGLMLAAVAALGFFKVSIVLLGAIGSLCLLHGILVFLITSILTGPVLCIAGMVVFIDVARAWQDEMQKVSAPLHGPREESPAAPCIPQKDDPSERPTESG